MNRVFGSYSRITDQWGLLLVVALVLVLAYVGYLPYLPLDSNRSSVGTVQNRPSHTGLAVEWLVVSQSPQAQDAFPPIPEVRHSVVEAVGSTGGYHSHPQIAAAGDALIVAWNLSNSLMAELPSQNASQRIKAAWSSNGLEWEPVDSLFELPGIAPDWRLGAEILAIRPFLSVEHRTFAVAAIHEVVGFASSTTTTFGEPEVQEWSEAYPKLVLRLVGYWLREVFSDRQLGPPFRLGNQADANRAAFLSTTPAQGEEAVLAHLVRLLFQPGGMPQEALEFPPSEITTADRYRLAYPTTVRLKDNRHFRLWSSEQKLDRLYVQFSPDAGVTWTAASPTNIPNAGRTAVLGLLPAGPVYLIGNQAGDGLSGSSSLSLAVAFENLQFTQCYSLRSIPLPPSQVARLGPFEQAGDLGLQASSACAWGDAIWIVYSINSESIHLSRIPLAVLSPSLVEEVD
jgi:hypothetical protein